MRIARLLVAALIGSFAVLPAGTASAHERRQVGDYELVVGWWTEPAFANQPNGPEVTITKMATKPKEEGKPVVEGVELSVDLTFEGETATYQMEPAFVVDVFGDPGNYNADLYPTRPGTYEFHITGTIEGNAIDEVFTSGPETFSDIENPAELAFPVADPAVGELAERVENESVTVDEELAATDKDAGLARTLGYIGIGLGLAALVVAFLGRRKAA